MNRRISIFLALMGTLGLSACQTLTQTENGQSRPSLFELGVSREEQRTSRLLAYHRALSGKPADELEAQAAQLHETLGKDCSDERLKLALIYVERQTEAPAELLQPCLEQDATPLAGLLQSQLQASRAQAQTVATLRQNLEEQRRENAELRRQLDGLRAIERSLQGRDRSAGD